MIKKVRVLSVNFAWFYYAYVRDGLRKGTVRKRIFFGMLVMFVCLWLFIGICSWLTEDYAGLFFALIFSSLNVWGAYFVRKDYE